MCHGASRSHQGSSKGTSVFLGVSWAFKVVHGRHMSFDEIIETFQGCSREIQEVSDALQKYSVTF